MSRPIWIIYEIGIKNITICRILKKYKPSDTSQKETNCCENLNEMTITPLHATISNFVPIHSLFLFYRCIKSGKVRIAPSGTSYTNR